MKKPHPALAALLCATAALFLAACSGALETVPEVAGSPSGKEGLPAGKGRVIVSIAVPEEAVGSTAAGPARTLLPEYGALSYTVKITGTGETTPAFTQDITTTSVSADLEEGAYTVSVEAKNGDTLVAVGSGTVSISLDTVSPVTIRLASAVSGTGTFAYTALLPEYPSITEGNIRFFSLSGGTNPPDIALSAGGLAGSVSLPAGFYRAVITVKALGKRVAQTRIIHISDQTTTGAEFELPIGDFIPSPPDENGSVIYIATQADLEAIRGHIGSAAMNYGRNAYVLLNDIALSGIWTPIGSISKQIWSGDIDWQPAFQGYFFGEGRRITGLMLSDMNSQDIYAGLFGVVHKALIRDITLETADFQISLPEGIVHTIGLVTGGVSESELSNITVLPADIKVEHGSASGVGEIGGAAGYVLNSRLRGITVAGAPDSSLSVLPKTQWAVSIGGIVGYLGGNSEIAGSGARLAVSLSPTIGSGEKNLGGIAGINSGTIRQSYYSGALALDYASHQPNAYTGGIAGANSGTIEACYASPLITIDTNTTTDQHYLYTGGLVGENTGTVRNSYAACGIGITVTTTSAYTKYIYSGGVAGSRGYSASGGSIEKCYAAGSLAISTSGTNTYDQILTGGITGNDPTYVPYSIASSAALVHGITIPLANAGAARIAPSGPTLTGNITFKDMQINGAARSDAGTDPQNDADGLGKTAVELRTQSTYSGLGWDFAGVWEMGSVDYPYPILRWQNGTVFIPEGFAIIED